MVASHATSSCKWARPQSGVAGTGQERSRRLVGAGQERVSAYLGLKDGHEVLLPEARQGGLCILCQPRRQGGHAPLAQQLQGNFQVAASLQDPLQQPGWSGLVCLCSLVSWVGIFWSRKPLRLAPCNARHGRNHGGVRSCRR